MVRFVDIDTKSILVRSNIRFLILKHSGIEILAYILQDEEEKNKTDPKFFYVFHPVKLTSLLDSQTGVIRFMMVEWISKRISDDIGFEIRNEDVLTIANVDAALVLGYEKFCVQLESYRQFIKDEPVTDLMNSDSIVMNMPELAVDDEEMSKISDEEMEKLEKAMLSGNFIIPTKKTIN